jgi:hypothetical protein
MKKITTATDLGGAPITKADLRTVFSEDIWAVIDNILVQITPSSGIIVGGCDITGAGPYNIAAGILYINQEYVLFAGANNITFPYYLYEDAVVNDSRTFADGTTHTLFVTRSATGSTVDPGGVRITINSTTANTDQNTSLRGLLHLKADVINALNSVVTNQALSAAQGKVLNDSKANIALATGWTDIPFGAKGSAPAVTTRAQYCKDSFGFVHLRGGIKATGATTISSGSDNLGELAVGFRPATSGSYSVTKYGSDIFSTPLDPVSIVILTGGDIRLNGGSNGNVVNLDGISFYA